MDFNDEFKEEVKGRTRLADIVAEVVVLKRKSAGEYIGLCPFHSEKTPSFTVSERKGFYKCFGCSAKGDCFDFMEQGMGIPFKEALAELAERAGMIPPDPKRKKTKRKPLAPKVDRVSAEEQAADDEKRVHKAQTFWRGTQSAIGTIVEVYLSQARGIDLPKIGGLPPTIRFVPRAECHDGKQSYGWHPAMVAQMVTEMPTGPRITAVHKTFLRPDGSGKADIPKNKLMQGLAKGAAIRLGPASASQLTSEGIETGFSIMQGTGRVCWPAGSMSNMGTMTFPALVREQVFCGDGDAKKQHEAEETVRKMAHRRIREGIAAKIAWAERMQDFNDMLRGE